MNRIVVPPIAKGLDLPISGAPDQKVEDGPVIRTVAVIADDFVGMKPTMAVKEGDHVKQGQVLFEDKKTAGVQFTSPACGKVQAVHRGPKRKFESVLIEVDGDDCETFSTFENVNLHSLDRDTVQANLIASGLWTALRTRPYSKTPTPGTSPHSLFVTAIDSNPLAPDPSVVLNEPDYERYFIQGLQVLTTLSDGPLYLCQRVNAGIPGTQLDGVSKAEFSGPHPSGLVGTHIHFLDPVNEAKTVWHIGYQDVVAVGHLFLNGTLLNNRIVSVAGPAAAQPRIIRSQLGASTAELTELESESDVRVISGSVLSGRHCVSPVDYLGRFHNQVSLIAEANQRDFLGWAMPGLQRFSVTKAFASGFRNAAGEAYPFSTSTQGSKRAIVPIGVYERVMPLDLIATPLLKSLSVQDTETAQMLGCLELDEEDLGLCTFVCPGKNDYGPLLRQCLTHIEREG